MQMQIYSFSNVDKAFCTNLTGEEIKILLQVCWNYFNSHVSRIS